MQEAMYTIGLKLASINPSKTRNYPINNFHVLNLFYFAPQKHMLCDLFLTFLNLSLNFH
ncbi:hypothetical protein IFVP5_C2180002 [Vibrio parahaemolyticus]